MSKYSVPQKINRARLIVTTVAANPVVFANPNPTLAAINSAIDDLEIAWNDAADGGKIKTALMHDKESELLKLLNDLAHYVEGVANGDEAIVHLAGLEVKKYSKPTLPDFEVFNAADRGAVGLRVKAHAKTIYRWEYCKDPIADNTWQTAKSTNVSNTFIGDLESGTRYWFRVRFDSAFGESMSETLSWIVE